LVPITGKVIPSNTHSVQIAVYDNEVGTPLIATNFTSGNIMQYSPFTMQYMIVDEANVVEVKPLIYYGLNYSEEIATLNALNNWTHTFITPGVYDISI
jgi:hypothetical protein